MNRIFFYQFFFCLILFTLFSRTSSAQEIIWAKSITSSSYEYGVDADLDSQGNLFIIGHGNGPTLSMDSITLNTNGKGDAFIAKFSSNHQLLWFRMLGGDDKTYHDQGLDIHVDAYDNVLILVKACGNNFRYNGDTLSGINSPGQNTGEGVIIKIDNNGNYLWHDDGSVSSSFQNVTTDSYGNVYLTGWFSTSLTLGGTLQLTNTTNGTTVNMFVAKYSPNGALIWAKHVGGTVHNSFALGHNIALDEPSGKIVVVGRFNNSNIYFDTGDLTTTASYATFLVAYDTSGTELWKMSLFNNDYSYCQGLDISSDGLIGVAGFNHLGGQPDGLVGFYDLNGNIKSEEFYSSSVYCSLSSIEFNHLNECFITGLFADTLSIGSPPNNFIFVDNGNYSSVILKLSSCLTPIWVTQSPSSSNNKVSTKNGRIFYSGRMDNPFIYNNGQDSIINNSGDAVFAEISDTIGSVVVSTDTQLVCNSNSYTWIDGNTYTSSNYSATHSLTNAAGCDSVVILNLTINPVLDITTSLSGLNITANNANASHYQWLDCNNGFSVISNETGISLTATQNGSYAVEIGMNGCIDTSDCVIITSVGVDEFGHEIKVIAYPNPTDEFINITFDKMLPTAELTITDSQGKTVSQSKFRSVTETQIKLGVAAGIYYLDIKTDTGQKTICLIKK